MTRISIRTLCVAALLAMGIAGCGTADKSLPRASVVERPPTEGLYVVHDGKVGRLDDAPDKVLKTWPVRSNLGPNVEFLIYNPALAETATPEQLVSLRQVAYVRANIAKSGGIHENKKTEWIVSGLDPLNVPAKAIRASNDPALLRVVPNEPLPPGLYALTLRTPGGAVSGRFGVEWSKSDKRQYAREHCVDRYLTQPVLYRPCAERDALENAALKVQDLNITKALVNSTPTLVIEGRVKNASATKQPLPVMLAILNDRQGKEIRRWTFAPDAKNLSPGTSVAFRTTAAAPPRNTAGVAILLSP